ncbi:peptidase U32 family protein [Desulfonatronovibrio magnus]|uniref:peptidase U32 family protein n=1 Tax=Desulfonatronovibrio magnus TaxID=698827 RepID=UPI0005EB3EE3|nr:U32 family peptidase [Desulfonatronovibrio magnus]RQD66636.1 MAG: U32 family peptidase [Desulfonatronovibrio sp. MSAO_Bac4]
MIKPEILAPAGSRLSFLAALSAGADAVYCGLKHLSARMEADNFSIAELSSLTSLAKRKNCRVYVALNTLIKHDELDKTGRLLQRLEKQVQPDAIIFSDLGLVDIAQQVGIKSELHLSTLSNFHCLSALDQLKSLNIKRVVLPRELNIDEIKHLASLSNIDLEVFVHGALCYAISGRCYWSSYLGGKSGLRGRCVQPCRRSYTYKGSKGTYFSCQDLGLDILAKTLLDIPQLRAWKIEGRKKGPHYVFYTTKAYQIIRDNPDDPRARKQAIGLLNMALSRKFTHYNFLPQRPFNPIDPKNEPASGQYMGKTKGSDKNIFFTPWSQLQPGDLVRIGYEGQSGHKTVKIRKPVPSKGKFNLPPGTRHGSPVFLVDRQEKELMTMIREMENQLDAIGPEKIQVSFQYQNPKPAVIRNQLKNIDVFRFPPRERKEAGIQLSLDPAIRSKLGPFKKNWYFLPPVIWPGVEKEWIELTSFLQKKGAVNFVLGSPWQNALFNTSARLNLWAGPFCNIANSAHIRVLKDMGFKGIVLSPELAESDMTRLMTSSPLPTGVIIQGLWPVCISRTFAQEARPVAFFESPKKETFWTAQHDENYYTFPNWEINLRQHDTTLRKSGCCLFLHLKETLPKKMQLKQRPGLWNWEQGLL